MGLNELADFIPNMITAIAGFLSTGIMFYIMSILIFAVIIKLLINLLHH